MPAKTKSEDEDEDRMRGPKTVKVMKYSKRGGQRPEVRRVRVLGNERLTHTGRLVKAKPKQRSIKKRSSD